MGDTRAIDGDVCNAIDRRPGSPWIETLHPELRAFADKRCGSLANPVEPRREIDNFIARHRRAPARVEGLTTVDLKIDGPGGPATLGVRLYRPASAEPLPVLVHFHGGAFVLGSPTLDDPKCRSYAWEAGCAVVSVDYRLAPEHPFPAALDDGLACLDWIANNAKEQRFDVDRIAVSGSSAGGALAAAIALAARDKGGPEIVFQLLAYPVLDDRMNTSSMTRYVDTPVFARHAAEMMWHHYLGAHRENVSPLAAPARAHDLSGLPPSYIEACSIDPLFDEDCAYAERLRAAGVSVELRTVDGAPHGYDEDYLGAPAECRLAETMRQRRIAALRAAFGRSARSRSERTSS